MYEPIVKRYPGNPVLTKKDIPYPVHTVHNAGVAQVQWQVLHALSFPSRQRPLRAGVGRERGRLSIRGRGQAFSGARHRGTFPEIRGRRGGGSAHYLYRRGLLHYLQLLLRLGVRIGLAKTTDFQTVERVALITEADYRNIVLFPEKDRRPLSSGWTGRTATSPRGRSGSAIPRTSSTGASRNW